MALSPHNKINAGNAATVRHALTLHASRPDQPLSKALEHAQQAVPVAPMSAHPQDEPRAVGGPQSASPVPYVAGYMAGPMEPLAASRREQRRQRYLAAREQQRAADAQGYVDTDVSGFSIDGKAATERARIEAQTARADRLVLGMAMVTTAIIVGMLCFAALVLAGAI